MKLFACVCLVLVIFEEYHFEPCLLWPCGGRRNDNEREKKLSFGLGFTAKTMISGQSAYKHENGYGRSYHPYHKYPPYGPNGLSDRTRYNLNYPLHGDQSYHQNGLGHRPNYQLYYSSSRFPSYRTPYPTRSSRPFGATYNILYGRNGGASTGTPQRTPYHRGSNGMQYDRPRFGTLYPTPFGMAHQTPNGASNGSPNGAPNSSPNSIPNGTSVKTGDDTSHRKQFFVTPTGIQETPAQPLDNGS